MATEANNIPELRFDGFSDAWPEESLSKYVMEYKGGASLTPADFVKNSDFEVVPKKAIVKGGLLQLSQTNPTYCTKEFFENNKGAVVDNSFLITTLRDLVPTAPSIGLVVINKYDSELIIAQGVYGFKVTVDLVPQFLTSLSNKESYRRLMYRLSVGSTQVHLRSSEFFKIKLHIPKFEEQKKIAAFLSSVDDKLNKLRRKRERLETFKRGLMQKIFSQQLRFTQDYGTAFPDWKKDRLDSFIERVNIEVEVESHVMYKQIGVRSHGKGVFHKEPVNGKALGNKRVFWVHTRAFVVNIVFGWEQAVALTSESEKGFIASHRFPMFVSRNNKVNLDFMLLFFLSKKGKYLLELASPGGAGRNKTLGQNEFARLEVTFPCIEEQQKIAKFISSIDKKITAVSQQITQTEVFKKGLLQKMFV